MKRYETRTTRLSKAEKNEMLALVRSSQLRNELRAAAEAGAISFEDYIAFATAIAKLANHPRRTVRPVRDSGFKL